MILVVECYNGEIIVLVHFKSYGSKDYAILTEMILNSGKLSVVAQGLT